jgi:hypothetical protein
MPTVRLSASPRMADHAHWATACELVPGAFMRAYEESAIDALADVVEQDGVLIAISAFMQSRDKWEGEVTQLLAVLEKIPIAEQPARWKDWPRDPGAFGRRLTTAMAALRKSGIACTRTKATKRDRTRLVKLQRISAAAAGDAATEPEKPTESGEPAESAAQPAKPSGGSLVPFRRTK